MWVNMGLSPHVVCMHCFSSLLCKSPPLFDLGEQQKGTQLRGSHYQDDGIRLDCCSSSCAIFAVLSQCAASPGFNPAGQHQVLPVFGPSSSPATPSAAPTYSYLPVVSGQLPFDSTSVLSARLVSSSMAASSSSITADHRDTGSPPGQDLEQHDVDRRAVLCPTLSHACFEVWIAMELCDGGTLAEQLQRGFHCHPGSEQVDMVSTC